MYEELVQKLIPTLNFKFPYSVEEWCNHYYLENYHSHSFFSNPSTTDSPTSMEQYVERVKKFGTKCIYSMEHGTQGNYYLCYDLAEKNDLICIHGTEAYWVKDRHEKDNMNCHIILHALNNEGRREINYMLSIANEDGYYYKPRVDLELIMNLNPQNIICTSACIAAWKYEDADTIWLKIAKHFGKHFFFELQYHNTESQKILNKRILKLSKNNGIDIICGLDSHYIEPNDTIKRDQLLEYKNIQYPDEDGWYMDYPDTLTVINRFKEQGVLSEEEIIRSILNTNIFASNEVIPIVLDRSFKIPTIYPDKSYDEKVKIYKNELNKAYKKEKFKSKEKTDGIRFEAGQVIDSGVVDYFLTSKKMVDLATTKYGGILTTTGRGSSASFVTNKLFGLTTIDRFNSDVPMYAERFLTKDRVIGNHSLPDIDNNIVSQQPFISALKEMLGEHSIYPLMAIEVLKEKNAWQMYASNANIEPSVANQISKYIDAYNMALKHADDDEKANIHIEDYIKEPYYSIYMQSRDYQGIVTNLKCHACGVIMANFDVRKEIGLVSAVSKSTGNRTLCAAIEGSYLDEFGLVKEDLLIVDSVGLTYEFFKSIGQDVPSFDVLREMIKDDKSTWDIYANGITCCVNQCEKESTTQKVMKYKPQNISELAQFIAAIRPGFASLLNVFLNRQPYTTGEPEIDKVLEDSAHFMLFQESIMKVLNYLGLPMSDTYGIIKSISKKKLKGEKKEHLLATLKADWKEKIGNLDNFDKIWKVISDAARYSFNCSHAYEMAGDSLYQAWFKAHHTAKFYEVAIKHYQQKGKKEKIDALLKEALNVYGYKLADYKFGDDNREVHVDDKLKLIIPNISSIKGIGDNVGTVLYDIGKVPYKSFYEVLEACYSYGINTTIVEQLIEIDYFDQYGEIYKLLQMKWYYELFKRGTAKSIGKNKVKKYNLPVDIIRKYSKETDKMYSKLDSISILNELKNTIQNKSVSKLTKLRYEYLVMGICRTVIPEQNKRDYLVLNIDSKKSMSNISLYSIQSGKIQSCKCWNSTMRDQYEGTVLIKNGDIIRVLNVGKVQKKEKSNFVDPNTGKYIYQTVDGVYEYWLRSWSTLGNDE